MVISHRHRYLYFVVPKAASATVRQSLAPFTDVGYPVSKYPQHVTIKRFLASEHARLFDAGYFRFTFVRNPYDRLYSGYMQDRLMAGRNAEWRKAKEPIFRRIGDDFNRYLAEYVRHADVWDDWEWICFCPMHAFAWLDGQCVVDFVGRSEAVDEGLTALSERLNVQIAKAADRNVKVQPSGATKYLEYYDRATIELVNETYREDFERFAYPMVNPQDFPVKADRRRRWNWRGRRLRRRGARS